MGSGGGFGAIFVPRGHVLSLLGGAQAFEISSKASSLLLMGLVVAYGALAVQLGRRA
jgi:hypothetical protein